MDTNPVLSMVSFSFRLEEKGPPSATVLYFPLAQQDQFRWSCDCHNNPLSASFCCHIQQAADLLGVTL